MSSNHSKSLKAKVNHLWLALGLAAFVQPALALQNIDCSDGNSHLIKISQKEMTRISIDGDRIKAINHKDGELDVAPQKDVGEAIISPLEISKPINAFIRSAGGQTCAVIFQVEDIPLETVIIKMGRKPSDDPRRTNTKIDRTGPLETAVKKLVTSMAREETPVDFEVTKKNVEIGLWAESRFVLTSVYSSRSLIGERYRLTNISKAVMRLAEQELYKPGVVSVSIENQVLNPGESTDVFITKQQGE